jgi:hypothetical protein
MSEIDLDKVPLKDIIERLRRKQIWKRDISNKKPLTPAFTVDSWIESSGIGPGPFRVKVIVTYTNYNDYCIRQNMETSSILPFKKFTDYINKQRLFPRVESGRRFFYNLNKDITPEDIREKERIKKEQKKKLKKAKEALGSGSSNL